MTEAVNKGLLAADPVRRGLRRPHRRARRAHAGQLRLLRVSRARARPAHARGRDRRRHALRDAVLVVARLPVLAAVRRAGGAAGRAVRRPRAGRADDVARPPGDAAGAGRVHGRGAARPPGPRQRADGGQPAARQGRDGRADPPQQHGAPGGDDRPARAEALAHLVHGRRRLQHVRRPRARSPSCARCSTATRSSSSTSTTRTASAGRASTAAARRWTRSPATRA